MQEFEKNLYGGSRGHDEGGLGFRWPFDTVQTLAIIGGVTIVATGIYAYVKTRPALAAASSAARRLRAREGDDE